VPSFGRDFGVNWDDWNVRNVQPRLDAYDRGLRDANITGGLKLLWVLRGQQLLSIQAPTETRADGLRQLR